MSCRLWRNGLSLARRVTDVEYGAASCCETIMERAGSVLVKAEKRKVNHFEVVTPYRAAVVKGTRFKVSAEQGGSNVEVIEG
jgi:hypothetical protein